VAFADNYDILSTSYNSYEADISCTFTVNEPMKVFGVLSQFTGIDDYVNLQMLAEDFCNSKSTGLIKINSSNDFEKGKMSYEVFEVVPFKINRNLKITAEMQMGMWLEWDISDEMNPTFNYILQQPFADKYISMDLVDMLAGEGINVADYVSSVKGRFEKEYLDDMNKKITDLFRKNSASESFAIK